MELKYERLDICILYDILKNDEIRKTLAYMIDFKEHENLEIKAHPFSIEISNSEICIAVLVFVGFEKEEYEALKTKKNHHVVSFDRVPLTMFAFESIPIKHIEYSALAFTAIARTENIKVNEYLILHNLSGNERIYRPSKK